MVLSMPSPYKHPTIDVYWYRQRVPARLKASAKGQIVTVTIGGHASSPTIGEDLKVSLRTKAPAEAKRLANEAQAEFDRVWRSFEAASVSGGGYSAELSHRQIHALVGRWYDWFIQQNEKRDEPAEIWEHHLDRLADAAEQHETGEDEERSSRHAAIVRASIQELSLLSSFLAGADIKLPHGTLERLIDTMEPDLIIAFQLLHRRATGDYRPDTHKERFPASGPESMAASGKRTSITALLEAWSRRLKQPRPQTVTRYTGIIRQLIDYLGHDDAERLTDSHIVRWHADLTTSGTVTHDTFIKAYRAAISAVYEYGMTAQGGKLVSENPAAKLLLEGERTKQSRPKSFYVEEAHSILRHSLAAHETQNNYSEINRLAMRWVPWICAYTGARAGEVCQLRKQDFVEVDGVKCIALLPDAGTIKTDRFRHVPLHPHLLEQGLWRFAQFAKAGPLFYNSKLTSAQPWVQTVQVLGSGCAVLSG